MFQWQINNFLGKKDSELKPIGESMESDIQLLLRECKKNLKNFNEEKIKKAFMLCIDAHQNKLRKSGQPYYTHPLEVARIVINEIPLDEKSVISALLHDVLDEGEKININDIRSEFGDDVANIVEGIHKIEHIENKNIGSGDQLENYRKLLLSLFKDIRIILIKLADRLHNMRTLDYLSEYSRMKLSKETLDIYAPFANRFGLRNLKWELEDLSFRQINRTAYDEIKKALKSTREERQQYIDNFITPIIDRLQKDELFKKLKVKFNIEGRPKHIYSIYNKMKARNKPMNELYDLFAVRVVLETDDPNLCFYAYGLIAGIYQPVPDTFKDYINNPKRNGYQSIHTAVVGINKKIVEVQLRTQNMHEFAEDGFAAHFRYKSGKLDSGSIMEKKQIIDWINVVREIFENAGINTNEELIDSVKKNLFFDEIYVYTPKNEFRTLPKDSTPLDFAFSIHSEIGYRYIGSKVNSKIAPIDYKLQSGDQVEILTSKNQTPKAEWLKYAVTSRARSYIIKYLKDEEKEHENNGKEIWATKCKEYKINISDTELENLVKSLKFKEIKDFYIALSTSKFDINQAFEFIKFKLKTGVKDYRDKPEKQNTVYLTDSGKIDTNSKPIEFDESNFTISKNGKIFTNIKITAQDKPQMLERINSSVISTKDISILGINFKNQESVFIETIKIKLANKEVIKSLLENLYMVDGVIKVEFIKNIIEE